MTGSGDQPPVSLAKVTLTKAAPSVSLSKAGSATGLMRVNLNWNAGGGKKGGFLRRLMSSPIDLDLGCLYQYSDGSKGVVQALGNAFRDRHSFGPDPICWLDGDDRSGANAEGENLFIRLDHVERIKRILVFAYIYEGVPNWSAADGVVTLFPVRGPQVDVRLEASGGAQGMCGIAMLKREGDDLSVHREMRYVADHDVLSRSYRWGMKWKPGRK